MKIETNRNLLYGLAPIADAYSEILILGSMPGKESLDKQEYYAKNTNAMWRIIADIFNNGVSFTNYSEKVKCLHENHIAMWDTLKTCERKGSLDSAIRNEEYNDIHGFLQQYPKIRKVIANGAKAAKAIPYDIDYIQAGSTSAAHAVKYEKKLAEWRELLK